MSQETPLIVFEGIDNSGKTTISKIIHEKHPEFEWLKEPVFSTEEADQLNSSDSNLTGAEREFLFLKGRIERQKTYRSKPVLLDRYLWSGMAYAKAFSPEIAAEAINLYQMYWIFKKPTVTVFMDTPIETCQSREPSLTIARLVKIYNSYMDTKKYVNTPIITIDGSKSIDECVEQCEKQLAPYFN